MASKVTIPNTFASATTAIPLSQLDANFSNVNASINNALTYSNYAADAGTPNTYSITIAGQTTTYAAGIAFQFKAANTNTGASTLNVNAQGAQSILRTDGTALVAGDILAGAIVSVMYDGTNFQLLNDSGGKAETFSNVTITGTATIATANVTTFSPAITNAQLANSTATLGNATITLGGTTSTVGNLTMNNVTINSGNATLTNITATSGTVNSAAIVNLSDTQTLTNKTITGTKETVFTITDAVAFEIDPANGGIQLITLGASRTPKGTNFTAGQSVTMMIDDGTAYTITWTDSTFGTGGVKWVGGTAPTLATTGYTVIELWKVSTQVYGAYVGAA